MPKKPKPAFVPPKMIGEAVDLLYTTRQERLSDIQPLVVEHEEIEKALKAHLIAELPKSQQSGASGKVANAKIVVSPEPAVEDWDKLYAYIKRKNRFDLLGRRLNDVAVREMWDRGETVPGVGTFNVVKVSVTKL